ncbi:MAG: hypothetical protein ACI35S_02805 [Anaeroplasma sp.]
MDNNKIKEFSDKYRKHQIKLAKGIMIFLTTLGVLFIGVGFFLILYKSDYYRIIIGIIMIIAGILNIPLGIKFKKLSIKATNSISDLEAARRYMKIYGINEK